MWSTLTSTSRYGLRFIRPRTSFIGKQQRSSAAPVNFDDVTTTTTATTSPSPSIPWNTLDDGHPWRPGSHSKSLQSVWGTIENPVPIASSGDSRLVACTGEPLGQLHEVEWIQVNRGTLSSCPKCNQVFKLISKN